MDQVAFGDACADIAKLTACPVGFVAEAATPTGSPPFCVPDPSACGQDPYGGVAQAAGVAFVAAGAPPGGDGSRALPYNSLFAALQAEPPVATIAVAAGTYVESRLVTRSVQIRGRCAALVHVVGKNGKAALWFEPESGALQASVVGVSVSGPAEGVVLAGGARVHLSGVAVQQTHGTGIAVVGAAAAATVVDSVVDDVAPSATQAAPGLGLAVEGGATLTLSQVRVARFATAGVLATGNASRLYATDVSIHRARDVVPGSGAGHGLLVVAGASAVLDRVRVTMARSVGVVVEGAGSRLAGQNLAVNETQSDPNGGDLGYGLEVAAGAQVAIKRAVFVHNRDVGVSALGPDTVAQLRDVVVRATQATQSGTGGRGVQVGFGATLQWAGGRVDDNRELGVAVAGTATRVALSGVRIVGTLPEAASQDWGRGLDVAHGAAVTLLGCVIEGNHDVGLAAWHTATELSVIGSEVIGTLRRAKDQQNGHGVVVREGAIALVQHTHLKGNHTAALVVYGATAAVLDSAVAATKVASYQFSGERKPRQLADGIVAAAGAHLVVGHTVVSGSPRAGLLVDGATSVALSASAATANFYGLVVQASPATQLVNLALWGNAGANRRSDGQLQVPAPPQLAKSFAP